MIEKSSLKSLRTLDFYQVMTLIKDSFEKDSLEELKLTAVHNSFEEAFKNFADSLNRMNSTFSTKEINKADQERNKILSAIAMVLRAFSNAPQEEQAKNATKLYSEMEKYGKNIAKLPLREKSAAITNLLQDFRKSENQKIVHSFAIDQWITKLENKTTAFDELYKNRSEEQLTTEAGKIKDTRVALQKAFEEVVKTINANAYLNGVTPYKTIIDKINQEVKRSLVEVKRRTNRKQPA